MSATGLAHLIGTLAQVDDETSLEMILGATSLEQLQEDAKEALHTRGLATQLSSDEIVVRCKATLNELDLEQQGYFVSVFDGVVSVANHLVHAEASWFKMNYFQAMIATRFYVRESHVLWAVLVAEPGEGKSWMMLLWAYMFLDS